VPPPDATEDDLGPAVDEPEKDTSGDGFSDQLLLNADVFDGADPLRKNVFVEVDYERGIPRKSVEKRMREMQEVFADAPVRNPDGSMGIDVHYVVSDEIEIDGSLARDEMFTFRDEHFDRALKGYFYMVFVENLEEVLGAAAGVANVMITENTPNDWAVIERLLPEEKPHTSLL
jgi:hypothetical protein